MALAVTLGGNSNKPRAAHHEYTRAHHDADHAHRQPDGGAALQRPTPPRRPDRADCDMAWDGDRDRSERRRGQFPKLGSVADQAGFEPGDVIASVDGHQINTVPQLATSTAGQRPGAIVEYPGPRSSSFVEISVGADDRPAHRSTGEIVSFAAPLVLIGLFAVPVLCAWYVAEQRRRERAALAFATEPLTASVAPNGPAGDGTCPSRSWARAGDADRRGRPAASHRHRAGQGCDRDACQRRLELDAGDRRAAVAAGGGQAGRRQLRKRRDQPDPGRLDPVRAAADAAAVADQRSSAHGRSDRRAQAGRGRHRDRRGARARARRRSRERRRSTASIRPVRSC